MGGVAPEMLPQDRVAKRHSGIVAAAGTARPGGWRASAAGLFPATAGRGCRHLIAGHSGDVFYL
jgi:hypothetical protein